VFKTFFNFIFNFHRRNHGEKATKAETSHLLLRQQLLLTATIISTNSFPETRDHCETEEDRKEA
jgi:hypothetical protein